MAEERFIDENGEEKIDTLEETTTTDNEPEEVEPEEIEPEVVEQEPVPEEESKPEPKKPAKKAAKKGPSPRYFRGPINGQIYNPKTGKFIKFVNGVYRTNNKEEIMLIEKFLNKHEADRKRDKDTMRIMKEKQDRQIEEWERA